MMPLKEFDGCGTFNTEIYLFFSVEFKKLCSWLDEDTVCLDAFLGQKDRIKIWLVACLAKTIKTDFRFEDSIPIM